MARKLSVSPPQPYETTRTYWGWTVRISCEGEELFQRVLFQLPPPPSEDPESRHRNTVNAHFTLTHQSNAYELRLNGEIVASHERRDIILAVLENKFQMDLATNAPDAVFVHAGVVAKRDRCVVLPGKSYSGKSTLVHALSKQGATYFSDEFAVIDKHGWIHPYRRPITIRRPPSTDRRIAAENFPLNPAYSRGRLALLIDCKYRKKSRWNPMPLTPGQGLLSLLSNTVSAQLTPERDFSILTGTFRQDTVCYRAERGEARLTATRILALLNQEI